MKILVTGGSGFLGSHLCDLLSDKKHKVTIFDIKKSKYKKKNQKMFLGSVLDKKKIYKAVKNTDFVYHFAALADIDLVRNKPLQSAEINIIGTINVLNACLKYKVKRFILASSIYANAEEGGFYSSSKKAAESYVERFYEAFGLKYTILRFGSLYGSRSDASNGINIIINSISKGKKIIYGRGKNKLRKYIHVKDAVNICTQIIKKKYENKYLIITGQKLIKVKKLLETIAQYLDIKKNKIKYLNQKKDVSHYDTEPTLFKSRAGNKMVVKNEQDIKKYLYQKIKS